MRKIGSYAVVVAASLGLLFVPHTMYYDNPELILSGLTNQV